MSRHTFGRLAAAAVIVLSLSGCMKVNVDFTLKSNNTVDGSMILAVNQAILQLSGQDPKALADEMNKQVLAGENGPKTARTEAYSDGTFVGTKITFLDEPISTFNGSSAIPSTSPTDGTSSSDQLKIVREGDDFVVSGAFDTSTSGAGLDTSPDASALMTGAQLLVSITFPGEVKEHNGTLKGRTVTWTPKIGERTEMHARGSAVSTSPFRLWLIVAGAGVLLLVLLGLLIAWLIIRGRRKAVPAQAQAMALGFNSLPVMYAPDGNVAAGTIPTAPAPVYGAPVPPVPPVEPPVPPVEPPVPPVAPPVPPVEPPV
jgi:hypothetical protein